MIYTNQTKTVNRIYIPISQNTKNKNDRMWRTITIHYAQFDDTFAMPRVDITRSLLDSEEYITNSYPIDDLRLLRIMRVIKYSDSVTIE